MASEIGADQGVAIRGNFGLEHRRPRWRPDTAKSGRAGSDGADPPALVLHGALDVVIPPANAEALAARWRADRVELLEGGGHAFMAQEPRRVANDRSPSRFHDDRDILGRRVIILTVSELLGGFHGAR